MHKPEVTPGVVEGDCVAMIVMSLAASRSSACYPVQYAVPHVHHDQMHVHAPRNDNDALSETSGWTRRSTRMRPGQNAFLAFPELSTSWLSTASALLAEVTFWPLAFCLVTATFGSIPGWFGLWTKTSGCSSVGVSHPDRFPLIRRCKSDASTRNNFRRLGS
jgi:hypothetical protein